MGAEFIHGENACTHVLLKRFGLIPLPVNRKKNLWWPNAAGVAEPACKLPGEVQQLLANLVHDYHSLVLLTNEEDISLAAVLRRKGWDFQAISVADVLFAQTYCADIDSISVLDLLRERSFDAGDSEFRVCEGYSELLRCVSQSLKIELDACVRTITWKPKSGAQLIKIEIHPHQQHSSSTIFARKCVVTVPVGVLQAEVIKFDPPLGKAKQGAIESFQMNSATKLLYMFDSCLWDDELTYMCQPDLAARWWTPGYGRHSNQHIICCYVTDKRAAIIDNMEEPEALNLVLKELAKLLGTSFDELQTHCKSAKRISWATEPFTLGGYANSIPGRIDARIELAASVDDVLFFAGEATAFDSNPQTVHGAFDSGVRVAKEVYEKFNL